MIKKRELQEYKQMRWCMQGRLNSIICPRAKQCTQCCPYLHNHQQE